MAFIDYYKIMGISRDTPQDKIRLAYKKRAKQFHPDLHPDDPKAKAKFQALNEAYDVLNDPEKRAKYDQYGEHWKSFGESAAYGSGSNPYQNSGDFSDFDFSSFTGGNGGFSSFFEDLFGRSAGFNTGHTRRAGRASYASQADYNMNATVDVDVFTALLGGEIILQTQTDKLRLKIKPCTQNGSKARLRGKGYDKGDGTFGDLIITYNVKIPTSLTERQQELIRQAHAC